MEQIMTCEPNYDRMKGVTDEALQFVKSCLSKVASNRPTIAELMESPWMQTFKQSKELLMRRQIELGANIL